MKINLLNIEEIIINKINEIQKEYSDILFKHRGDLNYINQCAMQNEAMTMVLKEILEEIKVKWVK